MASELSIAEQTVLASESVQTLAGDLDISIDDASDLLFRANESGRLEIKGNDAYAVVMVDDQPLVVRSRSWLCRAANEYTVIKMMERQFEDDDEDDPD